MRSKLECGKKFFLNLGRGHTLSLTRDGIVYAMGSNCYGQCGRPIIKHEDYLRCQIIHKMNFEEKLAEDKVIDIVCGMDHRLDARQMFEHIKLAYFVKKLNDFELAMTCGAYLPI